MTTAAFFDDIIYNDKQVVITPMLESDFTKEIRIVFMASQVMKEHKTAFPITVMVLQGSIAFGLPDETVSMKAGDIIALEPNVVHSLTANEDAIVRLSLSKRDTVQRVNAVLSL